MLGAMLDKSGERQGEAKQISPYARSSNWSPPDAMAESEDKPAGRIEEIFEAHATEVLLNVTVVQSEKGGRERR